jgi:hypothetical protein
VSGPVGNIEKFDFVDVEKLRVDLRHRGGFRLIVVVDELDGPAEQAALGVGFFLPDLGAEEGLLAIGRQRAGERHAEADFDRLAALRGSRRGSRGESGGDKSRADHAGNAAPCDAIIHGFLPNGVFSNLPCRATTIAPERDRCRAQWPGSTCLKRERGNLPRLWAAAHRAVPWPD